MVKVCYFFKVQIYNLRTLDLPELWPYGRLKGPKIEYEALKNNVLSSLGPMDENPRRHEQD